MLTRIIGSGLLTTGGGDYDIYLDPDGSTMPAVSANPWAVLGAATAHAALDDGGTPDDGDYIQRQNTATEGDAMFTFTAPPLAINAAMVEVSVRADGVVPTDGSPVKGISINCNISTDGSTPDAGGDGAKTLLEAVFPAPDPSLGEYSQDFMGPFTMAQLEALRVTLLGALFVANTTGRIRVYRLRVRIPAGNWTYA